MRPTRRRLDRLQRRLGSQPCRDCRGWEASIAVCDDRGRCTRPECCPGCGRTVPIRRAAVLRGIDLDRV